MKPRTKDENRAYMEAYRRARGVKPTTNRPEAIHGTRAKYRSCTDGEDGKACAACKKANSDYVNENNKKRRMDRKYGPDPLADYFSGG